MQLEDRQGRGAVWLWAQNLWQKKRRRRITTNMLRAHPRPGSINETQSSVLGHLQHGSCRAHYMGLWGSSRSSCSQ